MNVRDTAFELISQLNPEELTDLVDYLNFGKLGQEVAQARNTPSLDTVYSGQLDDVAAMTPKGKSGKLTEPTDDQPF